MRRSAHLIPRAAIARTESELVARKNQQRARRGSPHPELQEPARIGRNHLWQKRRSCDAAQALAEYDIFEHRDFRKTADALEDVTSHEDRVIAVIDAREAALQIVGGRYQPQAPVRDIERMTEGPAGQPALQCRVHRRKRALGKSRVDVQEQQHVTLCRCGAGVHLRASAAARDEAAYSIHRPRCIGRAVAAAAIYHDDLEVARLAQQIDQSSRDKPRFIQHGDDDGDHDAS